MTIEEIQIIISGDETRTVELKKTTGELKDAMHSLCAMLNSDGGYVIIGVAPSTLKIQGQVVSDHTRQEIAVELRKIEPYVNMPVEYIDVPEQEECQLIVFHADKHLYTDAPYIYNGKPYYKLESTTMAMPQQMYEDMLRQRDHELFRWDNQASRHLTIADMSERRIRAAVNLGVMNGRLDASAEGESVETLLAKLKLLRDGRPTNAAVMLFTATTDDYPEMELRMACFRGKDKNIFIDNKQVIGNFFDLLDAGIAFCFRNLRVSGEIKGLLREEKLEIPIEALREALINALCHRQYERTNGSVSLAIYDDRVEIINPGRFPAQLSPENIKLPHESYPYNKLIAQVLYQTSYLEKWGTGAGRIVQICREQNLPEPEWKSVNGTISIIFKRPTSAYIIDNNGGQTGGQNKSSYIDNGGDDGGGNGDNSGDNQLTERQRNIYNLLKLNGENTALTLARILSLSKRTVQREISYLRNNGFIDKLGTNNGKWIILK